MIKYKLVVMCDPVEGQDDEFNDWYTNQHLDDVLAQPAYSATQRFKLRSVARGKVDHRYLAIYDMDTDAPEAAINELMALMDTPAMPMTPALNLETCDVAIFEAITEVRVPANSKKVRSAKS